MIGLRRILVLLAAVAPLSGVPLSGAAAQIFYQDIVPDKVMDTWQMLDVNIDSVAGAALSYGGPGNLTVWEEFNSRIAVNAFSDCEVLMQGGYPAALAPSETIGPGGTWARPAYAVLYDGSRGNWSGAADRYLGVRVLGGGAWRYGWIRLDVNAAGNSVTVKDYACNRSGGQAIAAGQTSTGADPAPAPIAMTVSPHPATSWCLLSFAAPVADATVTLHDLSGRALLVRAGVRGASLRVDCGALPGGVYLLRVRDRGALAQSAVVIRRR